MTADARYGERDYARRCPVCGWVDEAPPAWEEAFVRPDYCPADGTPLETLACAQCGAPAFTDNVPTIGGYVTAFGRFCTACGGLVTRAEPRMVPHWRPKQSPAVTKLGPDGRPEREPGKWVESFFGDRPALGNGGEGKS